MKLENIFEKVEKKPGTYVGAKFTPQTVARLKKFGRDNNIPNHLEKDKYHSTIIHSKKHVPEMEAHLIMKDKWIGKPDKLEIFDTTGGARALVLRYLCEEQHKLHHHIMSHTEATYDYPEYKIHVTLSYDIQDFEEERLEELLLHKIGDLIIHKLYTQDLVEDWAAATIKKD
jgi:hypothetical protein